MSLRENLLSLRLKHNMTQKELSEKLGVSTVTIGNWERGVKQPSVEYIIKLSSVYLISSDVILGIQTPNSSSAMERQESMLVEKYRRLDEHGRKTVDIVCNMELNRIEEDLRATRIRKSQEELDKSSLRHVQKRYIPLYSSPAAAGIAAPLEGDEFEMILADNSVPNDADYAVKISGDSMAPYINDGDMVYIKENESLIDGDVGIFCVNGSMYCKQYYKDELGGVHLLSANKDREYASVHIASDSDNSVRLCGKVLGVHIPLPETHI